MNNYNRIYYNNINNENEEMGNENEVIGNENEEMGNENEEMGNENEEMFYENDVIDYKCVICFENILNLEIGVLNKLCVCTDSLVCNKCLIYMENNHIKKCPVCRTNLNFNIIKKYIFNIKNVILYYINFIIFILCNVIIYNVALNYKYYNKRIDYPIVNNYYNSSYDNDDNDDIFIIDSMQGLDIRQSYSNYDICKNSIIYKKNPYFFLTNLLINILFPLVLGINNSISLYKNHNDIESSKINIFILYVLTGVNMLNISIICIIKHNVENLKILLMVNFLLYGIIFVGSILLYFFTYIELFHKHMRNKNMIENIKYNILHKLYLNTIQTTNI